jgi:hypothetical protein
MRIVFVFLSLIFFISATNDCCLSDIGEELTKISKATHSDDDHANDSEPCEECQCSAFCSYNLVLTSFKSELSNFSSLPQTLIFELRSAKEKRISENIFHPPIA